MRMIKVNLRHIKYYLILIGLLLSIKTYACQITPSFTFTTSHTCGLPTIVSATNTSTGNKNSSAKYWWKVNGVKYNDTIIGKASATLFLKTIGVNTVRLFVKDSAGCIDSTNSNITVTSNAKSILDQNQNYTFTPLFMNCLQFIYDPDSFRVNLQSADTLKQARIFWGDGALDTSRNDVLPNTIKTHLYTQLGIFNIKIVTTNGSCIDTVYGLVYNQRQPTAGIIGPTSGSNRGCVPHTLRIINNSYNISNNTKFLIDWGNGDSETKPYTAFNDTFFHTYRKGVCAGIIKITATNVCGSSFSTWNPIDISDKDKALWAVATTCSPNSNFVFTNLSTDQYCLFPDVKEYFWDFGDSSTFGWTFSKASQSHKYKREGDYTVMLIAKTTCGNDTFRNKVKVYYNPVAGFKYTSDRSCKPLSVTVTDTSKGRGVVRQWKVTEGSTVRTFTDSILTYTFTTPGTHTIQLSVSNICGTSVKSKTFVLTDKPKALFANINSTCIPVNVSFNNTSFSYFNNPTYSWSFGDSTFSTLKNPSAKQYNKPGSYTVKLIVRDSCGVDSFSQTFTAYGLPKAIFTADSSACTFDSAQFINNSLNSNSYTWDFGDNQTLVNNTLGSVKHVYQSSGNYTITLISGTSSGCKDTASKSIFIKPGAKALFDINQSYACQPALFKFTNKSIYGKDYKWYANGNLVSSNPTLNDSLVNTDSTIISIKLIASSSSSCQDDSIVKTFFTPKNPKAIIGNKDSACGLLTITFNNQSTNYSKSYWNFGNGDTSTLTNPKASFPSAGSRDTSYTVHLKVNNWASCVDSTQTVIKLFAGPTANFSLDKTKGCGPLLINFSNASSTNNSQSNNTLKYTWNFGSSNTDTATNPSYVFNPAKSSDSFYTISLKVSSINACVDTIAKTIQVYPLPSIVFQPDKTDGCSILPVSFNNLSSPNDTGNIQIMKFAWNSGNGQSSTATHFSANYTSSNYGDTIYTVKLIGESEHACVDSATSTITVHPNPIASFNVSKTSACTPLNLSTINNSVSRDNQALTYDWDFGNTFKSSLINDSSLYINNSDNNSSFTIKLIAISAYNCKDTTTQSVIIYPKPRANFNIPGSSFCAPSKIQLLDSSINAYSYYWGQGANQFIGNKNESIVLPGLRFFDTTYVVAHQVTSIYGCPSDTVYKQVVIYGRPLADFKVSADSTCSSEKIQLSNTSLTAFKFNWDFGDNTQSTLVNPIHKFPNLLSNKDSAFKIRLIVSSSKSCKDTVVKPIYLVHKPNDPISIDKTSGCTDLNVKLYNQSTAFKTSYWDLGDNSALQSTDTVYHTYLNGAGNTNMIYKIKLYRQRYNCKDSSSSSVLVYPQPLADFIYTRNNPCDAGVYQIVNRSRFNTINDWYVDNKLFSSSNNLLLTLPGLVNKDTTYTIKLITNNNTFCADTIEQIIKAKRKLEIKFLNNPSVICEDLPVSFVNQSTNAVRYFWSFGDGGISNDVNPTHVYNTYGNFKVMLYGYDKDGCIDSSDGLTFQKVLERPIADFSFLPAYPKLPNALVNFTANPTILTVNQSDLSYEWDFGDSTFPTNNKNQMNPGHTYTKSGIITVTLRVANQQCMNEIKKSFFIEDPKPVVSFTPDTLEGCIPFKVHFKNNTINVTSYRWIFGDGSPDSYVAEPTHIFVLPGNWDVTLVATGTGGTTTLTQKYLITTYPKPILDFYTSKRFMSLPNAVFNFTNNSNTVKNDWSLIDSLGQVQQQSKLRDPSFVVNQTARFGVQLIGTNSYGCVDTLFKPNYISTTGPGYVYVPNAFSPNKNGRNDGFAPSLFNVKDRNYIFRVYNRWGEMVYETTDINGIWDGYYKGNFCEQDVYVWTVNGEYFNGDLFSFRGTVTLLR